jgi:hypothetical protein
MSKQTMEDLFYKIDAHYKEQVFQDTFGHLAPSKNKKYTGRFIYAVGCYGNDP